LFEMFARDTVAMIERVIAWDGRSWDEPPSTVNKSVS
jgi:hypothetical protein